MNVGCNFASDNMFKWRLNLLRLLFSATQLRDFGSSAHWFTFKQYMKQHPSRRVVNQTLWRVPSGIVCILLLYVMQGMKSSTNEHVARIGRSLLDDGGNSTCVDPGSQPDPCQFVIDNCGDVASMINYLEIHYCTLGHLPGLSFTLMVRRFGMRASI